LWNSAEQQKFIQLRTKV